VSDPATGQVFKITSADVFKPGNGRLVELLQPPHNEALQSLSDYAADTRAELRVH
jgi:hypothetical protein